MDMVTIFRAGYVLLLSYNPCDIFHYYNVREMHGLSLIECQAHPNTVDSAYIAGWTNFVPKASGEHIANDDRFIFINLSRCTDPVSTTGLIMHEMMHHSLWMHSYNVETREEDIITWAEEETYEVYKIVKQTLNLNQNKMKQTAVEWLVQVVQSCIAPDYIPKEIVEQAIEMEKKQIENAFNQGFSTPQWDKSKENKAEQYYNENFKSNKNETETN